MGQRNRNWVQFPKGIDFAKIFLRWVPWNHMKQLFMNTSISTNIWMYLPSCSQASNQYYNWVILDHFDLDIKSTFAIVPHMNYFMSSCIHSEKAPSSALTNIIDSYWSPKLCARPNTQSSSCKCIGCNPLNSKRDSDTFLGRKKNSKIEKKIWKKYG